MPATAMQQKKEARAAAVLLLSVRCWSLALCLTALLRWGTGAAVMYQQPQQAATQQQPSLFARGWQHKDVRAFCPQAS
jgi:hypothetical protein